MFCSLFNYVSIKYQAIPFCLRSYIIINFILLTSRLPGCPGRRTNAENHRVEIAKGKTRDMCCIDCYILSVFIEFVHFRMPPNCCQSEHVCTIISDAPQTALRMTAVWNSVVGRPNFDIFQRLEFISWTVDVFPYNTNLQDTQNTFFLVSHKV